MREYARLPLSEKPAERAWEWLKPLAGLLLLAAVLASVDRAALQSRLAHFRWGYVCIGSVIIVPQLLCLALRWQSVAGCLGMRLPLRAAMREYALAVVVNQLLPLGVLGDALRVWRQSRRQPRREGALAEVLHTVVVERSVGQVVLLLWAAAAAPLWLGARALWLGLAIAVAVAVAYAALRWRAGSISTITRARAVLIGLIDAFARVTRQRGALWTQLVLSSVILLGLVAQLYCALLALDLDLPLAAAARVFPYMLLSTALPLSIAGFGPREVASAGLYRAAHLASSDGLALGVAYGAMQLVATVPSLLVLLCLTRTPWRR
jgi:uncharacterized membrane protein YbhN (UPF0104 family)